MNRHPAWYLLGTFLAVAILGVSVGPIGALAGVLAGVSWVISKSSYAVAIGAIVAGTGGSVELLSVPAVGILVGLAIPVLIELIDEAAAFVLAFVALIAGLLLATVIGMAVAELLGGVVVVLASASLLGYGLHRYERVSLGLVGEMNDS